LIPEQKGIWFYIGHRRLMPTPYKYKIPNLYFLKDEPAPIEVKKIKIKNEPVESLKPTTGLFA
jgi:hypothetical protein